MWWVRRWPSSPSRRCFSSDSAAVLLLPSRWQVGFRGSRVCLARCRGCSCSHYLVPTAPTRGPCKKQTPRGLAEEAGERFPSPCHGCCCSCSCSPRDWETSTAGPQGAGSVRGFALVCLAPVSQATSPPHSCEPRPGTREFSKRK